MLICSSYVHLSHLTTAKTSHRENKNGIFSEDKFGYFIIIIAIVEPSVPSIPTQRVK